ncbi:hypothetical protein CL655_03695 [bacterium]|nr:hypothetical protein [bacterium]
MAKIQGSQVEGVRKLYTDELYSAQEIANALSVSLDAVYYCLRKYDIPRRTASENSRINFERKPLSFNLKQKLTKKDERLKLTGCLLYWCEGYKTEKSKVVDFANSDTHMVLLFLRFLRIVCGVSEKRLRVLLYCHEENRIREHINYWSNKLNIPVEQFTKPYVMKSSKLVKSHKMPYGLVHIRYGDKKLLSQILQWIDEYKLHI